MEASQAQLALRVNENISSAVEACCLKRYRSSEHLTEKLYSEPVSIFLKRC